MESSLAALWCDLRDKFRWFSVDQLNHAAACITFSKMDPVSNVLAISTKWLVGSYCYGQPILFSCHRTLFGAPLVLSKFCQSNRHCCQWSEKHCSHHFWRCAAIQNVFCILPPQDICHGVPILCLCSVLIQIPVSLLSFFDPHDLVHLGENHVSNATQSLAISLIISYITGHLLIFFDLNTLMGDIDGFVLCLNDHVVKLFLHVHFD